MLRPLILGFGRAGRGLHLPCLRKARSRCRPEGLFDSAIGVVDPLAAGAPGEDVRVFRDLAEVRGFVPEQTVVHVCTPPGAHVAALRQAVDRGYRRILVEKPLANTLADLAEVHRLQREHGLQLLVVANWLHSSLTARLRGLLQSGRFGPLRSAVFEQYKPRFGRTLANAGHASAFDVEAPHQVGLALHLAGWPAQAVEARVSPLRVGGSVVPYMGSAYLKLRHRGVETELLSRLDAHVRKRSVELAFDDHRVVGFYPIDSEEHYAGLTVSGPDGEVLEHAVFEDDPLTTCFVDCYRYFRDGSPRPASDLEFNSAVVATLCRARALAGLADWPAEGPVVGEVEGLVCAAV